MSRGSADFSNVRNNGIAHSVPSASELLNRPDGIISMDVRGQCILYNDFEDGSENGAITFSATPNYFGIARNNVFPGFWSLRLSTNAGINNNVQLEHKVPYSVSDKSGLEALLYCNISNAIIKVRLHFYKDLVLHEAIVRFDTNDSKTYILNSSGTFTEITSLIDHDFPRPYYQQVKLVVDFTTGKYVRVLLNGVIFDLSSYDYRQSATIIKPAIEYKIGIENITATAADLFIDNIIVTIQEP